MPNEATMLTLLISKVIAFGSLKKEELIVAVEWAKEYLLVATVCDERARELDEEEDNVHRNSVNSFLYTVAVPITTNAGDSSTHPQSLAFSGRPATLTMEGKAISSLLSISANDILL